MGCDMTSSDGNRFMDTQQCPLASPHIRIATHRHTSRRIESSSNPSDDERLSQDIIIVRPTNGNAYRRIQEICLLIGGERACKLSKAKESAWKSMTSEVKC